MCWSWSDCGHMKTKMEIKGTHHCAALQTGIKANLHAVQTIWP